MPLRYVTTNNDRTASCKGCGAMLPPPFLDLGSTPLANSYVPQANSHDVDPAFPLAVAYCPECYLVQLTDTLSPHQLFSEYLYFSSYSDSYLRHAREMAESLHRRF